MSVEVRIKAAVEQPFEPKVDGDYSKQVSISNDGLSLDEVNSHRWVQDVYQDPENDNQFIVTVSANRHLGF